MPISNNFQKVHQGSLLGKQTNKQSSFKCVSVPAIQEKRLDGMGLSP